MGSGPSVEAAGAEIVAAGAVVARKGPQVLLVHRPKYDDWSFPKGKLDPGEHAATAAVREVAEETGLDIRLGPALRDQTYEVGNGRPRTKRVHYWAGRLVGSDRGESVATYPPNEEIDQVRWVDLGKAAEQLSYARDRETLEEFLRVRKRSTPLIVLRHTKSRSRRAWRGDDRERGLTLAGQLQADQLVPLLGAFGVRRVVTSSARRCQATLAPYAEVAAQPLETTDALAEETATEPEVTRLVLDLLGDKVPAVLCTHRPVLPLVLAALGLSDPDRGDLEPGGMLVAHHRNGQIVAVETHQP